MSQRLRGEPSQKSSAPKMVLGVVAVLAAALILSALGGDGEEPATGPSRGSSDKSSARELARAAEQDRRKRAGKGRTGVFNGAGPGNEVFGTAGNVVTYSAATEEATGVRERDFAADVDAALGDPRSWTSPGDTRFERVKDGQAAVRIVLGTPATVDELCLPLDTIGQFSCREGGQLNINLDRWLAGADSWPLSVSAYRNHVINHEMGHFLGYEHQSCPSPDALAPVMMQQTKDLGGCKANEWPFPARPGRR